MRRARISLHILLFFGLMLFVSFAIAQAQYDDDNINDNVDVEIKIFRDARSLVLYLPEPVGPALNNLGLRIGQDIYMLRDYEALSGIVLNIPVPLCFRLVLTDTAPAWPGECANLRVVTNYVTHIYWHVNGIYLPISVVRVLQDAESIDFCGDPAGWCDVHFSITRTPTPTQIFTQTPIPIPTDTPTPEPTLAPTDTPTPEPILVPPDTPIPEPTLAPTDTPTPTALDTTMFSTGQGQINRIVWGVNNSFLITAHQNGDICVWLATSIIQRQAPLNCELGHNNGALALAWNTNNLSTNQFASSGADGRVRIWSLSNDINPILELLYTLSDHANLNGIVQDIAWNPSPLNNVLYSGGTDGRIMVWDTTNWTRKAIIPGRSFSAFSWNSTGSHIAAIRDDGIAIEIDPTQVGLNNNYTGRDFASHGGHRGLDIAWNSGVNYDHIITLGADGMLRLYDEYQNPQNCSEANYATCNFVRLAQNLQNPNSLAVSPNGAWAGVTDGINVYIIETQAPYRLLQTFTASSPVKTLAWNTSSNTLAAADNIGNIYLWAVAPNIPQRLSQIGRFNVGSPINSFDWDPTGQRLVIAKENANLSIWDVNSQQILHRVTATGQAQSVDWPVNAMIVSGGCTPQQAGIVIQWSFSDSALTEIGRVTDAIQRECVTSLVLNLNNIVATGDSIGLVRFVDTINRSELYQESMNQRINQLSWHPTGRYLAAISNTGQVAVSLADNNSLQPLFRRQPEPSRALNALAWHPSGNQLATGSQNGWIAIWSFNPQIRSVDLAGFDDAFLIQGHEQPLLSLSWHPSGDWLASLDAGGWLSIWDVQRGIQLAYLQIDGQPNQIGWSPDGRLLAISDHQGNITLWNFSPN